MVTPEFNAEGAPSCRKGDQDRGRVASSMRLDALLTGRSERQLGRIECQSGQEFLWYRCATGLQLILAEFGQGARRRRSRGVVEHPKISLGVKLQPPRRIEADRRIHRG